MLDLVNVMLVSEGCQARAFFEKMRSNDDIVGKGLCGYCLSSVYMNLVLGGESRDVL